MSDGSVAPELQQKLLALPLLAKVRLPELAMRVKEAAVFRNKTWYGHA